MKKLKTKYVNVYPCYKEALMSEKRFLILRGGAGSGKSYFATQKIIIRSFTKGHRFLVMRKYGTGLAKSVYRLFCDLILNTDLGNYFTFKKSPLMIENKISGSTILFSGLDDPEKIKSIAGITNIWLEEANEFNYEDFKQLNLRLRDLTPDYRQIMLSFNPIGTNHWIYTHFFDKVDPYTQENTDYFKTTYKNNSSLPLDYIRTLEALEQIDENFYSIYTLGEWGILSERIFKPFKRFSTPPTNIKETIFGIDFGFNAPTAMVRIDVADNEFYVTEVMYQTGFSSAEMIKAFGALNIPKNKIIYCDSASPAMIKDLKMAGYLATNSNKDVEAGINLIKNLHSMIYIQENSTNLIKELENYSYQKKGDIVFDIPVKFNDHATDGMRYGFLTHFGKRPDIQKLMLNK